MLFLERILFYSMLLQYFVHFAMNIPSKNNRENFYLHITYKHHWLYSINSERVKTKNLTCTRPCIIWIIATRVSDFVRNAKGRRILKKEASPIAKPNNLNMQIIDKPFEYTLLEAILIFHQIIKYISFTVNE